MSDTEIALRVVNILAAGIAAGGQILVALVLVPVKRMWPRELALRLHQDALITLPDRYLRPTVGVSFISAIIVLAVQDDRTGAGGLLTGAGILSTLGLIITAQFHNFRINRIVADLAPDPFPEEYAQLAHQWDVAHVTRTVFGTLAFVLYLLAAVVR